MDQTADAAKLNRTFDHIVSNPDLWDQSVWMQKTDCGTAYCFAGWTLVLEGIRLCDQPCDDPEFPQGVHVHQTDIPPGVLRQMMDHAVLPYDRWGEEDLYPVSPVAQEVLGLKRAQATHLFCGANNLGTIRRLIQHYTGGGGAAGQ